MNEPNSNTFESQFEAYLAGRLSPVENAAFESILHQRPQWEEEIRVQRAVDVSVRRLFLPPELPAALLTNALRRPVNETANATESTEPAAGVLRPATTNFQPAPNARWGQKRQWVLSPSQIGKVALAAVAAGLVWTAVLWQIYGNRTSEPYFARELVTQVHQRLIADGFRPYYICDDPIRFAQTFAARQGLTLRLSALPIGTKMLGLSYLGGLSRNTTTMLGESDGQPITVSIDRIVEDVRQMAPSSNSGLRFFRKQLESLVLYEVTPLDHPVFLDHFEVVEPVPGE